MEAKVARLWSERNLNVEKWNAIVSREASWVKEWLKSGLPNDPQRSSVTVDRDVFQWGSVV